MSSFITRLVCCAGLLASVEAALAAYDPLEVPKAEISTQDLTVKDEGRHREVPLRIYLPAGKEAAPVILFSHGLGGSRENSPDLGKHWAGRGYVAVFMQHAGSDAEVWKGKPAAERLAVLKEAASLENLRHRVQDVPAVLDQLERWNKDEAHPLFKRLDLARVGMTGHSFGAVTTQFVSGQTMPLNAQRFTEGRIRAAVAFSPSAPRVGSAADAFAAVKIPWLLMTGTLDTSPINDTTAASRQTVFPALPPGKKYELVLEGAEHSAFSDRALPGDQAARNPNHHRAILALSTAFWDAYLRENAEAQAWLDGDGAKGVLEKKDRWQRK